MIILGRPKRLLVFVDTDRIENDTSNSSSLFEYVFIAAVKFLPSRYLANIGDTLN
jgi:hypothetical protein